MKLFCWPTSSKQKGITYIWLKHVSNRKVGYVVLPCVRVLFETLVAHRSRNPAVNTGLSTKKVVNVSHCLRRPLRKGWPAQYWFKLSSQSSPTESRPVIWLTSGPVNSKQKSSWLETGMNVVAGWVHFKQAKALQTSSGQRPVSCEGGQLSIR